MHYEACKQCNRKHYIMIRKENPVQTFRLNVNSKEKTFVFLNHLDP